MTLQKTYKIEATTPEIKALKQSLGDLFRSWSLDEGDALDIMVSIDEALTNITVHGFKGITPSSTLIEVAILLENNTFNVTIADFGQQYDIENIPKPSIEENLKGLREGGFGVFLMKSLMDQVKLSRSKNKNTLQMSKALATSSKPLQFQL